MSTCKHTTAAACHENWTAGIGTMTITYLHAASCSRRLATHTMLARVSGPGALHGCGAWASGMGERVTYNGDAKLVDGRCKDRRNADRMHHSVYNGQEPEYVASALDCVTTQHHAQLQTQQASTHKGGCMASETLCRIARVHGCSKHGKAWVIGSAEQWALPGACSLCLSAAPSAAEVRQAATHRHMVYVHCGCPMEKKYASTGHENCAPCVYLQLLVLLRCSKGYA